MLSILKALDSKISSSFPLAVLIGGKLGVDGNTSNASICKHALPSDLISDIVNLCYDLKEISSQSISDCNFWRR